MKCLANESNLLFSLVKNRYQEFLSVDRSVDISDKLINPDFFRKFLFASSVFCNSQAFVIFFLQLIFQEHFLVSLCSNIAEYFDISLLQCRELLELGTFHDFESFTYNLWRHSLRFGIFPRFALNFFSCDFFNYFSEKFAYASVIFFMLICLWFFDSSYLIV